MFELRSIHELNQRIESLTMSGKPGGFPTHMNLHVTQQQQHQDRGATEGSQDVLIRQIHRLKEQNKMLTEEVGRKSNFITNLEQEKSVLIKQLFQARSAVASSAAASSDRGQTGAGAARPGRLSLQPRPPPPLSTRFSAPVLMQQVSHDTSFM